MSATAVPIVYVLLPQTVATGHGYLRGSGYVPSEFEQDSLRRLQARCDAARDPPSMP
jgi:hypothetical protein